MVGRSEDMVATGADADAAEDLAAVADADTPEEPVATADAATAEADEATAWQHRIFPIRTNVLLTFWECRIVAISVWDRCQISVFP